MNKKVLSIISIVALSTSLIAVPVLGKTKISYSRSSDISAKLITGGTIPAGNYTLSKGVTVTKDIIANGVIIDASKCPKNTIAIIAKANITGLTINYPQRQGISVQSCTNKTIKNCTVTHAQFAGIEVKNNVSNITLQGCSSNYNDDKVTGGENADGFGIKNGAKNITLKYCSSTGNSDDGYDCYTAGNNITFISCKAISNGGDTDGDGNGFKLGPCSYNGVNGGLVTVENCTATNNKGVGFLRNHNKVTPIQSGNIATGNKKGQFSWTLN